MFIIYSYLNKRENVYDNYRFKIVEIDEKISKGYIKLTEDNYIYYDVAWMGIKNVYGEMGDNYVGKSWCTPNFSI